MVMAALVEASAPSMRTMERAESCTFCGAARPWICTSSGMRKRVRTTTPVVPSGTGVSAMMPATYVPRALAGGRTVIAMFAGSCAGMETRCASTLVQAAAEA